MAIRLVINSSGPIVVGRDSHLVGVARGQAIDRIVEHIADIHAVGVMVAAVAIPVDLVAGQVAFLVG